MTRRIAAAAVASIAVMGVAGRRQEQARAATPAPGQGGEVVAPDTEPPACGGVHDGVVRGIRVPGWTDLLLVLGLGFLPALISVRWPALVAVVLSPVIATAFFFAAQFAFEHGRILPVSAPLFALTLGTLTTISAGYAAERRWRQRVTRRNKQLEDAVRERTAELRATQLEVIHRLAQATESRDQETGLHLKRISRMCERVGLAMAMTATEAETVRNASLHDVGKIGVPDEPAARLGRPGPGRRPESRAGTPRSGR